jgi:hypothetical protein
MARPSRRPSLKHGRTRGTRRAHERTSIRPRTRIVGSDERAVASARWRARACSQHLSGPTAPSTSAPSLRGVGVARRSVGRERLEASRVGAEVGAEGGFTFAQAVRIIVNRRVTRRASERTRALGQCRVGPWRVGGVTRRGPRRAGPVLGGVSGGVLWPSARRGRADARGATAPQAQVAGGQDTPRRTGAAAGRRGNNRERGNTAQSGADRVIPDACIDVRFARRARAQAAAAPVRAPRGAGHGWDAGRVSCGISTSFLLYTRTPHVHVLYMPFEHTSYEHPVLTRKFCVSFQVRRSYPSTACLYLS